MREGLSRKDRYRLLGLVGAEYLATHGPALPSQTAIHGAVVRLLKRDMEDHRGEREASEQKLLKVLDKLFASVQEVDPTLDPPLGHTLPEGLEIYLPLMFPELDTGQRQPSWARAF